MGEGEGGGRPKLGKRVLGRLGKWLGKLWKWLGKRAESLRSLLSGLKVAAWGTKTDPGIPDPNEIDAIREWLTQKQANLRALRNSLRQWRVVWMLAAAFVVIVLALLWAGSKGRPSTPILVAGVYFELLFLTALVLSRGRLKEMNSDAQVLEYETLLLGLEDLNARTAANLLFKHQFELKRYYDQNLRQNGLVFGLGAVCVLLGLAVVAGTALMIAGGKESDTAADIATAFLGGAGAALTGLVANVYLGMNRGSSDAMLEFHERLVTTNRMYLANLFVAAADGNKEMLTRRLVESVTSENNRKQ